MEFDDVPSNEHSHDETASDDESDPPAALQNATITRNGIRYFSNFLIWPAYV